MKKTVSFILILIIVGFVAMQIRFDLAERKYIREINAHTIILRDAIGDLIKFDQTQFPSEVKDYTTQK